MSNNEIEKNWRFLVEHKIFNVNTKIKRSQLKAMDFVSQNAGDEILNIRSSFFERCISVSIVLVDPVNNEINLEKEENNVKPQVWLEVSVPALDEKGYFDDAGSLIMEKKYELNCSACTFESAIEALAERVKLLYGVDVESSIINLDKTG